MKTIAVDLDDVLASSAAAWVELSNRVWGTKLTVEDYDEDWAVMWQVDREEEARRAQEIYKARLNRELKHDTVAYRVLKKLAGRYELVIATSRPYRVREDTLYWLDKYFPDIFKDVHQSGIYDAVAYQVLPIGGAAHKTKGELIKRIGADYLIDDQPKHCLAAAEIGVKALLFGDYKWNRDIGRLPLGVTRCVDWTEVEAYFDGRS